MLIQRAPLPYFFEGIFESPRLYDDPLQGVEAWVELTAPSGRTLTIPAFWDGGRIWRFRVDAREPGVWKYQLKVSDGTETEWLGHRSEFRVLPYAGPNPLYRHGPLRVAEEGTHLVHQDGTPFFWLADTAWNGLLKAEPEDWEWYLDKRKEQGFTAIQCVMTQWRACPVDACGERAFEGEEPIRINPAFFRRLDPKVAAIARRGMVPALVLLWALTQRDPGRCLSEEDAIHLARYIVARYSAFCPVWFLGGDGVYGQDLERWRRIGRAVFVAGEGQRGLATMHPAGNHWVGGGFREEPWYDFIGYQSSHSGDLQRSFTWIYDGPPAKEWAEAPRKPVINLEPCYEEHLQTGTDQVFDARHVRIASYYSLLVSPAAGVTYGHAAIWPWAEQAESPLDHLGAGITPLWHEAVVAPGAACMSVLKHLFDGLPWWRLRPAPHLVVEQPLPGDPLGYVAAALAEDQSIALVYLPQGGKVALDTAALRGAAAIWLNPRTAERVEAPLASGERQEYQAPDRADWLLLFTRASESSST